MKIAFVVKSIELGGIETFLMNLGRDFMDRGHAVVFFCTEKRGDFAGRAESLGIAVQCIPKNTSFNAIIHSAKIGKALAKEGFDAILLNHTKLGNQALNRLPDDVAVVPVIHGDLHASYRVAFSNPDSWNAAVAVSDRIHDTAERYSRRRPVITIRHGVRIPSDDHLAARRPFSMPFKLLYVGRLTHPIKGVMYLPDILEECIARGADVRLTVAGDGPQEDALRTAFSERGLDGRVEMTGRLSPDAIYSIMLDHHALLMPSTTEGFGLAALESQACGCVPVATDISGVTDKTIQRDVSGFLAPPGDIQAFAGALEKIMRDPARWSAMSQAGVRHVEAHFSFDAMASAYLTLFDEIRQGNYPLPRPRKRMFSLNPAAFTSRDLIPDKWRIF